jgi:hypothetical protein
MVEAGRTGPVFSPPKERENGLPTWNCLVCARRKTDGRRAMKWKDEILEDVRAALQPLKPREELR